MKNNNLLEQLAIKYMMEHKFEHREIETYYVGNIQYFRVSFWTACVVYKEFNGTLEALVSKLQK